MRKQLRTLTIAIPLLLPLGGCASLAEGVIGLPTGILTQSVQNPVTKSTLYKIENGMIAAVAMVSTYKAYCDARSVGDRCDAVVVTLQKYSKQARPLLRQLRVFVRKNDQVNAKVVLEQVRAIVQAFRGTAATEGIQIPVALGAL